MALHHKIENQSNRTVPWYRRGENEAIPVPVLGPDLIDPRQAELIRAETAPKPEIEEAAEEPAAD